MFNPTKAKHDTHGVWWCVQRTTVEVSMERVFGVTVHALPQRSFFQSITLPKPSLYIHLGSCAMNTAWSVCYIVTYLNDDTACIFLNLNLLDSPLQPGLL